MPSFGEFAVILLVGIMLFGRRLPEVGRSVGRTIAQLRQAFQKLKDQIDLDGDLGDVADTIRDARARITKVVEAPKRLANPMAMLKDLTDENLASPGPLSSATSGGSPSADSVPSGRLDLSGPAGPLGTDGAGVGSSDETVPHSLFEQELDRGQQSGPSAADRATDHSAGDHSAGDRAAGADDPSGDPQSTPGE